MDHDYFGFTLQDGALVQELNTKDESEARDYVKDKTGEGEVYVIVAVDRDGQWSVPAAWTGDARVASWP